MSAATATNATITAETIGRIKLPKQITGAVMRLMETAETLFPATSGAKKKAWVLKNVRELVREIDIKGLPDWIEDPLLDALVGIVIEALWGALFDAGGRAPRDPFAGLDHA